MNWNFFLNFILQRKNLKDLICNLINVFLDEIARVLEINGVFQYETDAVGFFFSFVITVSSYSIFNIDYFKVLINWVSEE